uniref:Tyr recombinase domain-containing protein n=1 Tax=Magallana gigas TaxID=29159 RepID=A0A8W8NH20_MAGGI
MDDKAITRYQFNCMLQKTLQFNGIQGHCRPHSFRIGRATDLAKQGWDGQVQNVTLERVCREKVGKGQHLKITDVVVQTYNNEKFVSTTGRTEVETVEAPSQLKLTENIMADNMEENGLSLIIDDGEAYPAYRISLNKITAFLNCEENCSWKILVVVFLSSYIINL